MNVVPKEHFAYLVKQLDEVHFKWADSGAREVTLTFYGYGTTGEELVMPMLEARAYWNAMIAGMGFAKGIE